MGGIGHKKAKNPQLEEEDPRSVVTEENRRGANDEHDIGIGTKENEVTHHKLRVLERKLSGCWAERRAFE